MELLIVIAIIAILSGVVLISLQEVRDRAKEATLKSYTATTEKYLMPNIVGAWYFQEGKGTTLKDFSKRENQGTIQGATWVRISGLRELESALQFNGTSNYIDLPNDLGYENQVSAFAWVKTTGVPAGEYHIVFGGQELEISIHQTGYLRTGVYTNTRFVSNHGSGLTDGNWHFVGFTFNGTVKRSYIDGNYVGEQQITSGSLVRNFSYRRIGRYGASTSYYLNGQIAEAMIIDHSLTDEEVKILYNSRK